MYLYVASYLFLQYYVSLLSFLSCVSRSILVFDWGFCHALDGMKPEDVGLKSDLQFFMPRSVVKGSAQVTFATIYKCDNFSVRMFVSLFK